MYTRGFLLQQLVFAVTLLVCGAPLGAVHAQTSETTTRPRVVTNQRQDVPSASSDSEATELRAHASQANTEAKRLHKEGVKYARAGFLKQAVELFERAVELKPDYADAHYSLGHAYFDLGRGDEAIQSLQRALNLNPGDKEARRLLEQARLLPPTDVQPDEAFAATPEPEQPTGTHVAMKTSTLPASAPAKEVANDMGLTRLYRVGPGDVLDLRMTGAANQSTLITITSAGLLQHPDLKETISVSGLTVEQISTRLEDTLRRSPANKIQRMSVSVHDYVSHTILVSGLVKEPGTKIIKREAIPLYVVVADAQPLAEAARASVARHSSNEHFVVALANAAEMNLLVRPGDVVTLQASPALFFYVAGKVEAPGEKTFRSGLTLTQAIIAAGGLSKGAKEARVARDDGKGFLVVNRYKVKDIESGKKPDPLLQAGDRITIVD